MNVRESVEVKKNGSAPNIFDGISQLSTEHKQSFYHQQ